MADSSKTLRHMLLGKLHRATVTRADLDYMGSITIDADLIEAAGFLEHEKVDIYNVTNGARLATYVIPGPRGSGEVGVNGAAAHLVKAKDLVIIAAYGWMKEKAARRHVPRVVLLDASNRPVEVVSHEENPPPLAAAAPLTPLDEDDEPGDELTGIVDDDEDDEDELAAGDDSDDEDDEKTVTEAPAADKPKKDKKKKKGKKK